MKGLIRRIQKKQGTVKLAGALGLLLALALIVGLMAVPAMAVPQLPHRVWGSTSITPCGLPVTVGAEVTAKIGETLWATTYVDESGLYGYGAEEFLIPVDDPGTPEIEGGTPGQTVNLFIEGIPAGSFTLVAGGAGEPPGQPVDLEVVDDGDPTGTILINGGAACTDNPNVTLALTCDDGLWGCGCDQMRFSNDNTDWTDPWKPVAPTYGPWALSAGDEVKTVYVQFLDTADNNSGSTGPISDDIKLDTTDPDGTISINAGAETTNSRDVTLYLTWDDFGGCDVVSMHFSNDDSDWSDPWKPVAATYGPWTLTEDDGVKTVYVEFLDAVDNNSNSDYTIYDDIELRTGEVVINEFVSDPGVVEEVEWIEFFNPGAEEVDLTDWTIEDGTGTFNELDELSVPAGGYLAIWDFSFTLDDSGDIIILKDDTATEIDKVAYGDWDDGNTADNAPAPGEDESTGRCPNGSDTNVDNVDFTVFATPTPLAANLADPMVSTQSATDITDVSATLNGSLDELGCPPDVDVSFEWGTTSGALDRETPAQAMGATGPFNAEINGLTPNTMYFFQAKADGGTVYGDELSFTTLVGPPLMTINLAAGWNTFSVPIDIGPVNNTLGYLETIAGLDIGIAYYFNGLTQAWGVAGPDYVMLPCDAIFIDMNAAGSVPIYPNPGTTVSAKDVYAGWNLVGSAFINETDELAVNLALISLYYAEGELMPWGYSQVISPALNQPGWVYPRIDGTVQNMLLGKGYWAAMDNPDEYLGQTGTPWEP